MEIKKVLVIFKTHLDVGYTNLAKDVVKRYMDSFLPGAVATAKELRQSHKDARLVWTTGSWLIFEYLRTHEGEAYDALAKAIENGDIRWHGLPLTTHTEFMSAGLFQYGLSLSQQLDQKFHKKTIAAKMTDVPGHTKAIIPYMVKAGIEFLHIGVNPASTVPDVPTLFRWKCDTGEMINVMYQNDYGEFVQIGDTDTALYFAHTGDNHGVQSPEDIAALFDSLKEQMPGAEIVAADLNDLALVVRSIQDTLPVITDEIGDTWIHGVGTDPKKVAQFRSLERFWETLPEGEDKEILARGLLMVPEHTWGLNGQLNLTDHEYFARPVFEEKRRTMEVFRYMESSWQEQREYLTDAVALLSEPNKKKALALLEEAVRKPADTEGGRKVPEGEEINFHGYTMAFSRQGEIQYLKKGEKLLADYRHRLVTICYEQFCQDDYKRFYSQYIRNDYDWAKEDFTKIGMYHGVDAYYKAEPENAEVYAFAEKIIVRYRFPAKAYEKMGCPKTFDLVLTAEEDGVHFDLAWFEKPANRIAEAIWVGFRPLACKKQIHKLGYGIDPTQVVRNGQCRLHATDYGVCYDGLSIETIDTALVAPQQPSILNFCNGKPGDEEAVYFNLYNNIWSTNFPMWYEEDARFRFVLKEQ